MSIYTTAKCIGGYVTFPLATERDLLTHRAIHFNFIIDAEAYTTLTPDVTLTDASLPADIGLDVFPTGIIPPGFLGYFTGDTVPTYLDGHLVSVTRTFHDIPASHTVAEPGSHTFPEIRYWQARGSTNDLVERTTIQLNTESVPLPRLLARPALTRNSHAQITYDYFYSAANGTDISYTNLTEIDQPVGPSYLTRVEGSFSYNYLSNCPAQEELGYVVNTELTYATSGGNLWPATNPSRFTYQSGLGSSLLTINSNISQYAANIYCRRTERVRYQ